MTASVLVRAITICVKAKRPCFIWGAPGIGKSAIVRQVAAMLGMQLKDTRAVHYDPVDLRGIPKVVDNFTKWFAPDFLPREGKGIWFLDELNSAPLAVQAAFYQLILDRRVGDYELPEGWVIVAAGNREQDRGVTNRMPMPLANRFVGHYELEVDANEWRLWAIANGIDPRLVAFFAWRPQLLMTFDPMKTDKAFTTPRTVEFLSDLIAAGLDPVKDFEMSASCVGNSTATEISGFFKMYDELPDMDEVLAKPETVKLPSNIGAKYALCGALANKATKKNMSAIVTVAERFGSDFGVLLMRDTVTRDKSLTETAAYVKWAEKNQNVFMN